VFQIYHNPYCKISRKVLEIIRNTDEEVFIIEYFKKVPTVKDLKTLLIKLNFNSPHEIIRQNELIYKKKFKKKNFSNDEWFQIIIENPILIERPIVIKDNKAIICRPPERINELITTDK